MSGAQEQPGNAPAVEESKQAEQAEQSFMAGFAEDENAQPTETPAAAPAPAQPAEAPPPAPEYVQVTKADWDTVSQRAAKIDEIAATLGNRFDQAFGKMGGLERKLAELQTGTPKGETVQVSDEDFAELKEEYPGLSELTVKGLNRMLGKLKGTGSIDPQAIEKAVAPLRDEMLETAFPGWKEDVKTPDFAAWRKTQGPEVEQLAASDKHADAAKLLRMFYARTKTEALKPAAAPAATPAPPAPAAPTAPAQPSMRSRQIAAAVALRGDSAAPPSTSGKTPFMAGFDEDD